MKVCTDACLFGAWIAHYLKSNELRFNHVLDIGAGTGLLGLMIAQNTLALIEAVEINSAAADQAKVNFSISPFAQNLTIHNVDINNFSSNEKFDLILCNPPFYNKSLKSTNESRNIALHDLGFSFQELIHFAKENLSKNGLFGVLIPYFRTNEFEILLTKNNLFVKQKCLVKQTEKHSYFRSMFLISGTRQPNNIIRQEILIKENGSYSPPFIELLKDYYLNF